MPLLHSISHLLSQPVSTMKPRPRLQDMPYLAKQRIVNHLRSYYEKMSLRTACPEFHDFIGDPHFHYEYFYLLGSGEIWMELYTLKPARDLEMLIDNSNLSISKLKIEASSSFLSKIGSILVNLKVKLKVAQLEMCYDGDQEDVLRILGNLRGVKSLKLKKGPENQEKMFELGEIMKLDQWRELESIQIFDYETNELPMEFWWKNPNRRVRLADVKLMDLKRIVEFFRKAPDFDSYEIDTGFSDRQIANAIETSRVPVISVDDSLTATFPKTQTKSRLHVEIREGRIEFNRRCDAERSGRPFDFDRLYGISDDENEEEDVNDHFDSRRTLESLKLKFCDAIKEPVMVGMDEGVVKHFEWDKEKKTYRKVDCEMCKGDLQMFDDQDHYYY